MKNSEIKQKLLNHGKDIIKKYNENHNASETARYFGLKRGVVLKFMRNNGLDTSKNPRVISEKIQKQIVEQYLKGSSLQELEKKHNVSNTSIIKFIRSHGHELRPTGKLNHFVDKIIYNYVNGKSALEILKLLNLEADEGTVLRLLRSNNVKIRDRFQASRKHSVDLEYFKNITREDQMWVLGWLYSDGNLNMGNNTKGGKRASFAIALQEGDGYILKEIKSLLKYDGKIHYQHRNKDINKKTGEYINRKPTFTLSIASAQMCEDLMKFGMTPNKSQTCEFPKIEIDEIRHFIRGYYEGDGTFGLVQRILKNGSISFGGRVSICVSEMFGKTLKKILFEKMGIKSSLKKGKGIWNLHITNNYDVDVFCKYIYENCNPKLLLERKYKRYLEFKEKAIIWPPFVSFDEAKRYMRDNEIKSTRHLNKLHSKGLIPLNIPINPRYYEEFTTYYDYFGTSKEYWDAQKAIGSQERFKTRWLSLDEAKKIIQPLGMKSRHAWEIYVKENGRPNGIPSNPDKVYKMLGTWGGYADFLGF